MFPFGLKEAAAIVALALGAIWLANNVSFINSIVTTRVIK
jgi:hypothetical protein